MPSSRWSWSSLAVAGPDCAPQKRRREHSSPNWAAAFIDHSSEMWNFRSRQTALAAVLAPRER
jgi:hypothetical protein